MDSVVFTKFLPSTDLHEARIQAHTDDFSSCNKNSIVEPLRKEETLIMDVRSVRDILQFVYTDESLDELESKDELCHRYVAEQLTKMWIKLNQMNGFFKNEILKLGNSEQHTDYFDYNGWKFEVIKTTVNQRNHCWL